MLQELSSMLPDNVVVSVKPEIFIDFTDECREYEVFGTHTITILQDVMVVKNMEKGQKSSTYFVRQLSLMGESPNGFTSRSVVLLNASDRMELDKLEEKQQVDILTRKEDGYIRYFLNFKIYNINSRISK